MYAARIALSRPDRATLSPFQARKPKRPRRAPPPSLDETALGRSGEEWALRGGCSRFKFALAVPIQTPCNIATSPRPSQVTPAGPHALVALTSRLRPWSARALPTSPSVAPNTAPSAPKTCLPALPTAPLVLPTPRRALPTSPSVAPNTAPSAPNMPACAPNSPTRAPNTPRSRSQHRVERSQQAPASLPTPR
eukprot:6453442-Prymnesium_polylepis.3